MTDDFDPAQAQAFVEQMRARLSQPMPLHQQRELALCTCIDRLNATLAQMRAALETAQAAAIDAMPTGEAASATVVQWTTSLGTLGIAVEQADRDGRATILAVRTLLQV